MELGYILMTAVNAIMPILLMILLGLGLRKTGFLSEDFLNHSNKLVFNLCLPVMLFINIYNMEGLHTIQWDIVLYTVCMICLLFILSIVIAIASTNVPERKGVVMQCVYRSNYAIIGLPLAAALGGQEAVTTAAVISAFCVPLYNVFSVFSLTVFLKNGHSNEQNLKSILGNIVKNPLIIGVAAGFLCLGIRHLQTELFGSAVFTLSGQMRFLYSVLNSLQSVATPLALIVLGGQFQFSAMKGLRKEIAWGTVSRTVLAPLIGIGLAVLLSRTTTLFSFGVNEYPALIAVFGSPVAVSSAIMAAGMHNDEQLATQLVVWTSLFSILTIFITVCIMLPMGLLTP